MSRPLVLFFIVVFILSCLPDKQSLSEQNNEGKFSLDHEGVSLIVLGTIQDAGSPHIACKKECCKDLFDNPT